MKALVTGADGFVGRHLVPYLEGHGDVVIGTDRDRVDLLDPAAVAAQVDEVAPDAVYHLAGWSDVGGSWAAPVDTFRANAEGTLNLLNACAEAGTPRVLAVSSADVYGHVTEADLPLTEEAPLRPVSPYAASKAAADFVALGAHLGRGLGVIRVRPFNHLGVGQSTRFVASALASRIARNELDGGDSVPVGNLAPRRDFTDVRDVVRAYRLLIEAGEPGEVYNLCSGVDVAIQDLADLLVELAHKPMRLVPDPGLKRPVDTPVLRGDNARIASATGWTPEIPLDQTVSDLLDDWRRRVTELPEEP